MLIILFKNNIDDICVPQCQLACIRDTTNYLHKNWLSWFEMFAICGEGSNSWNFNSGRIL